MMMKMNLLLVLAWVALIATVSVSAKDQGLRGRELEAHNEPDASEYFEGEENLLSPEEMEEMGIDEQDRDLAYGYGTGYGRGGYGGYGGVAPNRVVILGTGSNGYGSGYGGYGRGYGSSGYGGYGSGYGSGYGGYGRGNGYGSSGYGSGYGGYGSSGYGSSGYGGYGSGYGGYGYGSGYGGYGGRHGNAGYSKYGY